MSDQLPMTTLEGCQAIAENMLQIIEGADPQSEDVDFERNIARLALSYERLLKVGEYEFKYPEIMEFAQAMDRKLRSKDEKGDFAAWAKSMSWGEVYFCVQRAMEKLAELSVALRDARVMDASTECPDPANFVAAVMIFLAGRYKGINIDGSHFEERPKEQV